MNEFLDIYDAPTAVETTTATSSERLWTFEEYLEMEEQSVVKHEFHNGKLTLMAGGTDIHNHISGRVITALNNSLDEKDETYFVYTSDMKVRIVAENKSVYPDGTVVEGNPIYYLGNNKVILNPVVVVEVLSKSTEKYDRGKKFEHYKTLKSFREYVLVSQDSPHVEVHFLENIEENVWKITHYDGLDKEVTLDSIDCILKMKQIYHRVFK
jgi:Uma2 family endonuclease